jgi:hypothetical protein
MKIGLIELYTDIEGVHGTSTFAAIRDGVVRDRSRTAKVVAATRAAVAADCGVIVLPGWSCVADKPPSAVVELSAKRTIVLECIPKRGVTTPSSKARTTDEDNSSRAMGFVIHNRSVVVGPTLQVFSRAAEPWANCAELNEQGGRKFAAVVQARGPVGRRWLHPEIGETMLLLCGEANFVCGGGRGGRAACYNDEAFEREGLTRQLLRSVKLFLNPSHAPGGPQAIRDKRAWLSSGSILVNTANAHSDGFTVEEEIEGTRQTRKAPGRRRLNGVAKLWVGGRAADGRLVHVAGDLLRDGFRVWTYTVGVNTA